ncbi:transposable element Tcb2 transposase [Trichonephila clavipes]|nr:transposable element Tcb2 transposase [Trichonephila clavipes]
MEHVWDALGRRIAARLHQPENTQQLKQMLIEEWALLPQEMLHQLVLIQPKKSTSFNKIMKQEMQLFDSTEDPSPNIIKLCEALKTIPPKSVEAERVFSAAGLSVTKLRTRLSDKKRLFYEENLEMFKVPGKSSLYRGSLHWCAKIKDEVEKLAYQLNEEAERTERPIRRLRTAIRGFSSGHPRGTTPADDRYIVLQARRNRRQTAGEIARHTTQATGRPISRFTVARRLHDGGLFARRPVRCVPLTPAHRRRRSLWCREHRNWRDNEWRRVLFTDESRFSLSRDSHRILIWRERGSRNHPSNFIQRDRYGGRGVLVWGCIMLGSRTDLHNFDAGSVNGTRYCNEILLPYVRLFRGAMSLQFLFMDDNAPCHRTVAAEQLPSFSAWADAVKPA